MRRLLLLPIAATLAAFSIYLAIAGIGKADDPPAPPTPDPAPVEVTVQGKTAAQWHRVAARYLYRSRTIAHRLIYSRSWGNHWLERGFVCIHGGEGPWNAHTGNGYDGGVQMDKQFQRTYGADFLRWFGPAYNWPAAVQIAVAIRAYESGRGFHPWPNTARMCGLL